MKKDLISSLLFHLAVVLLLIFVNVPSRELKEEEMVIPMELLPIGEFTQSNRPKTPPVEKEELKSEPPEVLEQKEKEIPSPHQETKPQPPKSEGMVKQDPRKAEKDEAEKDPTEEESALDPEEEEKVPEEEEIPAPKPEPKKEKKPEKPKEKAKPQPAKKAPKKEEVKKKKVTKESILKNLIDPPKKSEGKKISEKKGASSSEETDDLPQGNALTMSEQDAVRHQLARCWKVDVGTKGLAQMKIPLKIFMNADRSIRNVKVVDQERFKADPFYQATARRAMNALSAPECTPLRLPLKKYKLWKELTVVFDPEKMAGGY